MFAPPSFLPPTPPKTSRLQVKKGVALLYFTLANIQMEKTEVEIFSGYYNGIYFCRLREQRQSGPKFLNIVGRK